MPTSSFLSRGVLAVVSLGLSSVALVACGSSEGSSDLSGFDEEGNGGGGSGSGGGPQFAGDTSGGGQQTDTQSCATSTAAATPVPVNLVFMFDQSGSMGGGSAGVKWNPVTGAMKSFFADPKSQGTSASLQYFPQGNNECSANTYESPEVGLTQLPNQTVFASSLQAHSPGGGTPTYPAINGAIAYARQVAGAPAGEATAIVLVTDGEPNDCSSDVSNVSSSAASVAAQIPTYVVGVGSNLQALDAVAQAGGTQKAIIVDANNGAQAATDFQKALEKIRGSVLACDYTIPPPPAGQSLDINKVNVVYTPSGGTAQTLTYNKDCTGGTGWHYDNAGAPTKIVLCQSTCDGAKTNSGTVSLTFGCATKGGVVR